MAEVLTCNLSVALNALLSNADALNTASYPMNSPSLLALALTSGTGANKVNQVVSFQRILASGGSAVDIIDMYDFAIDNTGGTSADVTTGVDGLGQAVALANVKVLIIQNTGAAADILQIGGENTTATWLGAFVDKTDIIKLRGGSTLIITAPDATGMAVADTTNHKLKIASTVGGAAVTYNFWCFGATA